MYHHAGLPAYFGTRAFQRWRKWRNRRKVLLEVWSVPLALRSSVERRWILLRSVLWWWVKCHLQLDQRGWNEALVSSPQTWGRRKRWRETEDQTRVSSRPLEDRTLFEKTSFKEDGSMKICLSLPAHLSFLPFELFTWERLMKIHVLPLCYFQLTADSLISIKLLYSPFILLFPVTVWLLSNPSSRGQWWVKSLWTLWHPPH